jgi:hypothetical protein
LSQLVGALRAAGINRTKTWVAMHLALAGLAPDVQRLVNQGKIGGEVAYQLRGLSPSEQVDWAERIVREGLSFVQLRQQLGLADGEPSPEEWRQHSINQALAKAANGAGRNGTDGSHRPGDPERRHGRAWSRWELMPAVVPAGDQRKLPSLAAGDWAKQATDVERQLAQEALFMGGYSAKRAISLAERAVREAGEATEPVMLALNALRHLLEKPADLPPDSALGELLSIRAKRLLQNLGNA